MSLEDSIQKEGSIAQSQFQLGLYSGNLASLAVLDFAVVGFAILVKRLERNSQEVAPDKGYAGDQMPHFRMKTGLEFAFTLY